ncbi:MAG TPA: hypothetical protein VKF32_14055, partial [Thermoanaerobaculia bacterium]|nr:hypothetical protein [Thermoanaerobaculia bacterium]
MAGLWLAGSSSSAQPSKAPRVFRGVPGVAHRRAVVRWADMAAKPPAPGAGEEVEPGPLPVLPVTADDPRTLEASSRAVAPLTPGPLSPATSASFLALGDNNTFIPPDTNGAAGPSHLMVTLNSQIRVQDKTGANLSTKTLDTFWSSVAGTGTFDPRVSYDPYGGRWIVAGADDANSSTSGILVGVSQTSDPTGAWNLYKVDVDATNTYWADFPTLGFNKDWIVVQTNRFSIGASPAFHDSLVYIFKKSDLYAAGTGLFTLATLSGVGGTQQPASTYDASVATLQMLQEWNGNSGGSGFIRIYSISGAVGSEVVTAGSLIGTANPWGDSPPAS